MRSSSLPPGPTPVSPRLGIQGPVVAWSDPWEPDESDSIMRTGTGVPIASHDPTPTPTNVVDALRDLGADFYVHHVIPGAGDPLAPVRDLAEAGIDVVLGNEYGNINGPYTPDTNRYDIPADVLHEAAATGRLAGVLYDEPEHLQINASQYRHDAFLPHFGDTTGQSTDAAIATIDRTIRGLVAEVDAAAEDASARRIPVLSEQVFPVLFHPFARAGLTPCPKVMKESFQPLQLSTALGASLQYGREFWICADLWGPDIGPWFTRAPGFPGHSPAEFASALRMAYLFAPSALFVENIDALLRHTGDGSFAVTEYGEVWHEFVRSFIPAHPLTWRFDEAKADIAIIHADDSNFGQGERPFGNRDATPPESSQSVFAAWHLVSGGSIPAHGSCLHIPGYEFPRQRLDGIHRSEFPLAKGAADATRLHGLFHRSRNVLVFDEHVLDERLSDPGLILAVGSRMPEATVTLLRRRAESGATVVIPTWLTPGKTAGTQRVGEGLWVVCDAVSDAHVAEAVSTYLGGNELWTQRFGDVEVRISPADSTGETLAFEIADAAGANAR